MKRKLQKPRKAFLVAIPVGVFICAIALFAGIGVKANPPEIYLIERFLTNQILLHFDTEGDRTYYLQYTDSLTLTSTGIVARWSNLLTVPAFPNHWVIVDSGTATQRFYRLSPIP